MENAHFNQWTDFSETVNVLEIERAAQKMRSEATRKGIASLVNWVKSFSITGLFATRKMG